MCMKPALRRERVLKPHSSIPQQLRYANVGVCKTIASSGNASSNSDGEVTVFNLLATEEDDDRRIQLLRKHCTLKSKMDELEKERAEQHKQTKTAYGGFETGTAP